MTQNEQLWPTNDFFRTDYQLAEIARNNTERETPRAGYPSHTPTAIDGRLFLEPEEISDRTSYTIIDGLVVKVLDLPGGHDAISPDRQALLENEEVTKNLLSDPDPEFPTGDSSRNFFRDDKTRVGRWLGQGCRAFTSQGRPLIPGIGQLLSLRTEGLVGDPLGVPTGLGLFPSHGLARMSDGVIFYESPGGKLDVLLTGRPEDGVWATVGGFGNRQDLDASGVYSPDLCVLRRCRQELGLAADGLKLFGIRRDYPVSSPSTASAALVTDPRGVMVGKRQYEQFGKIAPGDPVGDYAGWVNVDQLLQENGTARDGTVPTQSRLPVWTTHMRYIVDGLDARAGLV